MSTLKWVAIGVVIWYLFLRGKTLSITPAPRRPPPPPPGSTSIGGQIVQGVVQNAPALGNFFSNLFRGGDSGSSSMTDDFSGASFDDGETYYDVGA